MNILPAFSLVSIPVYLMKKQTNARESGQALPSFSMIRHRGKKKVKTSFTFFLLLYLKYIFPPQKYSHKISKQIILEAKEIELFHSIFIIWCSEIIYFLCLLITNSSSSLLGYNTHDVIKLFLWAHTLFDVFNTILTIIKKKSHLPFRVNKIVFIVVSCYFPNKILYLTSLRLVNVFKEFVVFKCKSWIFCTISYLRRWFKASYQSLALLPPMNFHSLWPNFYSTPFFSFLLTLSLLLMIS